jgi:hypothetical protein
VEGTYFRYYFFFFGGREGWWMGTCGSETPDEDEGRREFDRISRGGRWDGDEEYSYLLPLSSLTGVLDIPFSSPSIISKSLYAR